jgi:hypothetical protein
MPMTPSGLEPAAFRFVAQYLNHCATAVVLRIYRRIMLDLRWMWMLRLPSLDTKLISAVERYRRFGETCCPCIPDDVNPSAAHGLYHFAAWTLLFLPAKRVSCLPYWLHCWGGWQLRTSSEPRNLTKFRHLFGPRMVSSSCLLWSRKINQ